ncbi:MAG: nucleotidyltransferase family protein [Blautia sp.]|nr:nucleotidyltransferase family protein [Blautia sp.]MDD5967534.1 nucleotidyltransferase family protein [Blautia sp.]
MKTDLILMAAGNSRRFGSNKLLHEWKGKKLYRHMLDALLEAAEELEKNSGADTGNRDVSGGRSESRQRNIRVRVVTQYEEILEEVEQPGGDEVFQPVSGNACGVGGRQEKRAENQRADFVSEREEGSFLAGIYSPESVNGLSYTIRKALDFEAADPPDYFAFFTADTPELSADEIRGFLEAFFASGHSVACVRCGEAYGNPAVFSWKYAPLFQNLTGDQGGKKVLNQLLDDCFFYELPERSRRDIDTPEDL